MSLLKVSIQYVVFIIVNIKPAMKSRSNSVSLSRQNAWLYFSGYSYMENVLGLTTKENQTGFFFTLQNGVLCTTDKYDNIIALIVKLKIEIQLRIVIFFFFAISPTLSFIVKRD